MTFWENTKHSKTAGNVSQKRRERRDSPYTPSFFSGKRETLESMRAGCKVPRLSRPLVLCIRVRYSIVLVSCDVAVDDWFRGQSGVRQIVSV